MAGRGFGVGRRFGIMAKEDPSKPHSFIRFWLLVVWKGAKKSREGFGIGIEIAAVVLGIGLLFLRHLSKQRSNFDLTKSEESVNFWIAISPFGAALAWLLFWIFRQPYKIYREQFEKNEAEKQRHREEKQSLEDQCVAQIAAKLARIKELEDKLAEKSEADNLVIKRQLAKQVLGNDLLYLQIRLDAASKVSQFGFNGEIKEKEDKAIDEIVTQIQDHLETHLTLSEANMFKIARGPALPDTFPAGSVVFTPGMRDWHINVNYLAAKLDALKKIIEKLD